MFDRIIEFIRSIYAGKDYIPLHEPRFDQKEKEYVNAAIDSTFVSYVGEYVNRFEDMVCDITGSNFAVATVNGTSALHTALLIVGVQPGDEVISQPCSFVATANAISYCGARPLFLDVNKDTLGLDPEALEYFFTRYCSVRGQTCYNNQTGRRIAACVPMHTFGHPCRIDSLAKICKRYQVPLIEDAAESLGSFYKKQHTGTFGVFGVFSFNGNKTVTCGGGGILVTNDEKLAKAAKHLTTTAKVSHAYEYIHDAIGYNYRLPNINAALACAQLEKLEYFIKKKRELAETYAEFFDAEGIPFIREPKHALSNYWLNAIILPDRKTRNSFLEASNRAGVMTRPVWKLLNKLEIYKDCQIGLLQNAEWLEDRVVNIPSSVVV
ncbi:MAG: LegC family aminotransferase [Desulfobacterales bacterium]|nr:MAG: LegC family aminotransferase [Desulfobacterales bacterium]